MVEKTETEWEGDFLSKHDNINTLLVWLCQVSVLATDMGYTWLPDNTVRHVIFTITVNHSWFNNPNFTCGFADEFINVNKIETEMIAATA